MTSYDKNRYKHLPKFGYFVYNCHFPNKSVNHSETPYAVPEDYKNDNDFLQHYRSLRLSCNTDTDYIGAFPHFYYVVDLYEAIAYNQPQPDPTPFINAVKTTKPPYNNLNYLNRYNKYITIGTLTSRLDPFIHVWFSVSHRTSHWSFTKHQSPEEEA